MNILKSTSLTAAFFAAVGLAAPVVATADQVDKGSEAQNTKKQKARFGVGKTSAPREQGDSTVRTGEGNYGSGVDSDTQRKPSERHASGKQRNDRSDGGDDKQDEAEKGRGSSGTSSSDTTINPVESNSGSATSPGAASAPVRP